MSLGTHAAIGAIIISRFPSHPVLGFGLAFASHFVLDMLPHWDYHLNSLKENEKDPMKNRMPINNKFFGDLMKIGIDLLLGIGTALFLLFNNANILPILFGIGAGVLPDFLQFLYFRMQKEPLVTLQRFHMHIHTEKKMKNARALSVISQIILVLASYFITVKF